MGPGRRNGLMLLVLLAGLVLVAVGVAAGCGGSALQGQFALLHHGPGMDDVLLVLDGRIYSIPIQEGTPQPRLLRDSIRVLEVFIPLVNHEDDEMILYTFRPQTRGGHVELHSFTRQLPDGNLEHEVSFARDGEPPELMEEALGTGIPLTPVMFRNQQLTLLQGRTPGEGMRIDAASAEGVVTPRVRWQCAQRALEDLMPEGIKQSIAVCVVN